ncbi:hypothetical protein O181_009745 [Austropuccinia psidii MF-1]|uniref:Uncharacterized protein n=1 Tax=Austropuccinia psidii MF-1 TaxID=1389203 RepID=A0A9Q3BRV2_9BASI|nr:hypothetical protein [Austropuccinia psidii MF-1]
MVRRFCAYGLESKDFHGLTHNLCTILPALELAYKTSIHASNNQNPAILRKGWNSKLPQDSLRKDLIEIHPTAYSFKAMKEKARNNGELICISQTQMGQRTPYCRLQNSRSSTCIFH